MSKREVNEGKIVQKAFENAVPDRVSDDNIDCTTPERALTENDLMPETEEELPIPEEVIYENIAEVLKTEPDPDETIEYKIDKKDEK